MNTVLMPILAVVWTLSGNSLTSDNGWTLTLSNPKIEYASPEKRIFSASLAEGFDGVLDLAAAEAQTGVKIVEISMNTFGASSVANVKCQGITKVVFPSDLRTIGNYAFANCTNLTAISPFPEGMLDLNYSFKDCVALASEVNFSASTNLHAIGISAFQGCYLVPSVILPPTVTNIANAAFRDCTNMVSVSATPVKGASKTFMRNADGVIDAWAFGMNGKDGALQSIDIPWGGDTLFGSNIVKGVTQFYQFSKQPVRTIRFFGKAPSGNVPFLGKGPVSYSTSVICSKRQDEEGWRSLAGEIPSGKTPPEGAFGVWQVGVDTDVKYAWLVWGRSPFDPVGSVIIYR